MDVCSCQLEMITPRSAVVAAGKGSFEWGPFLMDCLRMSGKIRAGASSIWALTASKCSLLDMTLGVPGEDPIAVKT